MKQSIDIDEIKDKIYAKLEKSGWNTKLRGFIYSTEFELIIKKLIKQTQDGKRFTPAIKNWFRAFEECPVSELKVVMVGQDPYPGVNQADGVAFSLSTSTEMQPTLTYLLDAIDRTVYDNRGVVDRNMDLTRWSNQGLLMLNAALTTSVGKIGQHYNIWQPFLAYLFDYLTWHCPGLVYIYMGKQAQQWADAVNDNNYKFLLSHPASAYYNNDKIWDCGDTFVKTTEILDKNYKHKMIW